MVAVFAFTFAAVLAAGVAAVAAAAGAAVDGFVGIAAAPAVGINAADVGERSAGAAVGTDPAGVGGTTTGAMVGADATGVNAATATAVDGADAAGVDGAAMGLAAVLPVDVEAPPQAARATTIAAVVSANLRFICRTLLIQFCHEYGIPSLENAWIVSSVISADRKEGSSSEASNRLGKRTPRY